MDQFLDQNSGKVMILVLSIIVVAAVLVVVPQLLRLHQRGLELQHAEHMRALEQGIALPPRDERSKAAGRTAALVPMVTVCAAGTVTCFLVAFNPDHLFAVALAIWAVTGVVSLAAITGGVALMGRLAQLQSDEENEHQPANPLDS